MASRHIFKVRRGVRHVNDAGETIYKEDGITPERYDWLTYTNTDGHIDPLDGELVVEFEYNPGTKKSIPRLKIGDGKSTFAELDYISIDSFILPTRATITIEPNQWMMVDRDENIIDSNGNIVDVDGNIVTEGYYEIDENGNIIDDEEKIVKNRYVQFVNVANATVTPNSKVDIQPSPSDLVVFHEKDITFTAVNAGGHVRVCLVGQKPENQYILNATVTEVV